MTFWKTVGAVLVGHLLMTAIWLTFYGVVFFSLSK